MIDWENAPDLNEICGYIQDKYGKDIADRTHKCLIACMGMSDRDVELWGDKSWLEKLIEPAKKNFAYWKETAELTEDDNKALKSQLDEVMGALKAIREVYPVEPKLPMTWQIKDIVDAALAKHKEDRS